MNHAQGTVPSSTRGFGRIIFGPASGLSDPAIRRKSLLLAWMLAVMAAVFAVLDTYRVINIPGYRVPWYGYLFLLASFGLNRGGWYRPAAWLVMLMFPATVFTDILTASALDPVKDLNYLFLSLLAGGIFLSQKSLAVFILLEIAGILALPLLAPAAISSLGDVTTQLVIMVIGGGLVLLSNHYRKIIEEDRREKLRAAEEKYRRLIETTDTGYVIIDDQGRVLDANREYVRLTGRAGMEEIVGHSVMEWTAPHHHTYNAEQVAKCVDEGSVRNLEIDYLGPDGKITPVEINATVLRSLSETTILTLCRDITDRRRSMELLRESEDQYHQLFELESDAIFLIENETGRILQANRAASMLYGYDQEEMLSLKNTDLSAEPEETQRVTQGMPTVKDNIVTIPLRRHRKKDGTVFAVEITGRFFSWRGKSVHIAAIRDITERMRSEEALKESEQRFRNAFRDAPIGMALVDVHEKFLQVNQSLCDILGYTEEQLLATTVQAITHPEDLQVEAHYKKQTESGEIHSFHFEKRYIHADGHIVWGLLGVSAVRDEAGNLLYYIGQLEDITERKQTQEALEQANRTLAVKYEELKKVDAIKEGLLRDVTHELKTPVAKQAMQIELLRASLGRDCPVRINRVIEVMEQSIRRQEAVIRNLLNLARLEEGRRTVELKPVRVDAALDSVLAEYRTALDEAGIEVRLSAAPLTVLAGEDLLWHIFSNLVTNAIKFRKRTGRGHLEISAAREDSMAVLAFSDDGIGLKPEELNHVFERFYQATPSSEGSGIGLAICRMILDKLGGTITLESKGVNKGAVAVVRLPLAGGTVVEITG